MEQTAPSRVSLVSIKEVAARCKFSSLEMLDVSGQFWNALVAFLDTGSDTQFCVENLALVPVLFLSRTHRPHNKFLYLIQ